MMCIIQLDVHFSCGHANLTHTKVHTNKTISTKTFLTKVVQFVQFFTVQSRYTKNNTNTLISQKMEMKKTLQIIKKLYHVTVNIFKHVKQHLSVLFQVHDTVLFYKTLISKPWSSYKKYKIKVIKQKQLKKTYF